MTDTVLLTGAAGFLGTRTAAALRREGFTVVTTDLAGDVDDTGDLADPSFVRTLPDVDVVVHAAAVQYVTPTLPRLRRQGWFDHNNVLATQVLADRYSGKVDYFLQVGTSMMYDQTGLDVYTTSSPKKGVGVYSVSKLESVRRVEQMDNPLGIMVPCIIGGEGREGLFRGFVESMTRRGIAIRPGTGAHKTHMVHVDDAADLLALMTVKRATGLYNAAGPDPLSINEWIDTIADELSIEKVRVIGIPYALVASGAWLTAYRVIAHEQALMLGQPHVLDTTESLELGWQPQHGNERIVRDIARYVVGG